MGIPERKERHRDELKKNILAAAEDLFITDGYQNVSMRKIAERIEYSPTTIYRLFKNKAEIMEHLIAAGYDGIYRQYESIIADHSGQPFETLKAIIRTYIEFGLLNPKHYELWFATSEIEVINGQLHMRHGEIVYRVYHIWLEQIDVCKEQGLFQDRDTLTVFQLIWGSVHGLISLRIHHPRFPWLPLDEHVEQLLETLDKSLA